MGVAYLLLVFIFGGCGKNTETVIKFADVGWDSIKFHNAVAMFVAKEAYGFKTDEISATMPLTTQALKENDMDVIMEM